MEPLTASLVGAGVSSAASVASGLFGKRKAYEYNTKLQAQQNAYNRQAQERAFQQNKALSEYAYDRQLQQWREENQANIDFWNMQNAYNSPQAQMERYQGAGLNPNLVYGQSNTSPELTASSSPNMDVNPMEAEQQHGSSGVGDNLSLGNPVEEFYKVQQMQQSLENSKAQNEVLKSQANLNNMNALFGQTRNDYLESSRPYWSVNAQFDSLAKKITNDIHSANLSAMLFRNENLLPLTFEKMKSINGLLSQQLGFHQEMNPLKIKLAAQQIENMISQKNSLDAVTRQRNLDFDYDSILKNIGIGQGEFDSNAVRNLFIYFLRGLLK